MLRPKGEAFLDGKELDPVRPALRDVAERQARSSRPVQDFDQIVRDRNGPDVLLPKSAFALDDSVVPSYDRVMSCDEAVVLVTESVETGGGPRLRATEWCAGELRHLGFDNVDPAPRRADLSR